MIPLSMYFIMPASFLTSHEKRASTGPASNCELLTSIKQLIIVTLDSLDTLVHLIEAFVQELH